MIPAGLLRDTLTLESVSITDDGQGGQTESWSTTGSFRGRISTIPREHTIELMKQDKQTAFYTHIIFCDPMDVDHTDRIKWGSYYFQIVGITNPSEMYHHLEIKVREIVD